MDSLFSANATSISIVDLLAALGLAIGLGLLTAGLYRITHRGFTYERSFLATLVLMPPIVAVIMIYISSNLALSLGMVGALSIIRFRTVIKDSRDMVFLFMTIAIGLGCGTYNWVPVVISTVFIGAALWLLHLLKYGKVRNREMVLVIRGKTGSVLEKTREFLIEKKITPRVRSLETQVECSEMVLEVLLPFGREDRMIAWMDEMRAIDGVDSVSLLAPQLALPV